MKAGVIILYQTQQTSEQENNQDQKQERHYRIIKKSIHQKAIILNATNKRALKYINTN